MSAVTKMVLNTSDEAAQIKTITGWVSRYGRFWGDDEHMARYDGCTHIACPDCGAVTDKHRTKCDACLKRDSITDYEAMPREPWDGETWLYSQDKDKFYASPDDAVADCWDAFGNERERSACNRTLASLRLVLCMPNYAQQIDADNFCDALNDDGELPDEIIEAMEAFNAVIAKAPALSWSPSDVALQVEEV